MKLKGKSVLITGASRGLGQALAFKLAQAQAKVVLVARNKTELAETVRKISEVNKEVYGLAKDISSKDAIYPLVQQASELIGPIDILINNASTLGATPLRLLLDTECEDLETVLQTNTIGPFRLTKAIVGSMLVRGEGLVLNISSDASISPYPRWGAYSASKAALDHLTRIWGAELEQTPVKVLSVDPGEMNTQMHQEAIPEADPKSLANPLIVAEKILSIIQNGENLKNGNRLIASEWRK